MKNFYILLFTIIVLATIEGHAQNLEEISLKKGAKITGSFNMNTVGYTAWGIPQRRDPFNWFLTGNLNFTLFGYAAPFSFSYSNANSSFSQPFNQFKFAPQYKWIKTYVGNTSMTFSPYTLAGHMFFGGGVELTPAKWRIALMYGRLNKAVPFDLSDSLQYNKAAFERIGYGLKVGYESNGEAITFNIFSAKDDPYSIPFVISENKITPKQNIAMGLALRKKLSSKIFVNLEYSVSVLNTNTLGNTERDTVSLKATHNLLQGLLPENSTTRSFDAFSGGIGYQGKQYSVQLKYERIAPEYQTLGAYYFNNDMRNITVVTNMRLLNNKITLGTNIGVQENNLDRSRTATTSRTVGAATIQYAPTEKWSISGNYSNFLSYTKNRSLADPFYKNNLDTLNFYQVSQTTSATIIKSLGTKEKPQSLMVTVSYQRADNKAASEKDAQLSDFLNGNTSYSYSIPAHQLTLAIAANMYSNNAAGVNTTFWGPSINTTKIFFDKTLRCSYSTSYNQTTGNTPSSPVWNNQVSFSYVPKQKEEEKKKTINGKSNFSLSLNMLKKLETIGEQPAFTELTGTLNYSYSF
jgi:hypothetical protein